VNRYSLERQAEESRGGGREVFYRLLGSTRLLSLLTIFTSSYRRPSSAREPTRTPHELRLRALQGGFWGGGGGWPKNRPDGGG